MTDLKLYDGPYETYAVYQYVREIGRAFRQVEKLPRNQGRAAWALWSAGIIQGVRQRIGSIPDPENDLARRLRFTFLYWSYLNLILRDYRRKSKRQRREILKVSVDMRAYALDLSRTKSQRNYPQWTQPPKSLNL